MIYSPLEQKLWSLALGSKRLVDIAYDTFAMGEALVSEVPPAVYALADLGKIKGVAPYRTLGLEMGRIEGGIRTYDAPVVCRVKDVILAGGNLYKGAWKRRLMGNSRPRLINISEYDVPDRVITDTPDGAKYFGDWLLDDLPSFDHARMVGIPVSVCIQNWRHQAAYVSQLCDSGTEFLSTDLLLRDICIFDEKGITSLQVQSLERMRLKILGYGFSSDRAGVFLCRRNNEGLRRLSNEGEVIEQLQKLGFAIVDVEKMTVAEILSAVAGQRIAIGVEGSQMAHGLLGLPRGSSMLVLQPPGRFNNSLKDRCDPLGIQYGFVVGDSSDQGFSVEVSDVLRILEKMSSKM